MQLASGRDFSAHAVPVRSDPRRTAVRFRRRGLPRARPSPGPKCGSPPAWMSAHAALNRSSLLRDEPRGPAREAPRPAHQHRHQRRQVVRFRIGVGVGARMQQERHRFGVSEKSGIGQRCVPGLVQRLKVRAGGHQEVERRDRAGFGGPVDGEVPWKRSGLNSLPATRTRTKARRNPGTRPRPAIRRASPRTMRRMSVGVAPNAIRTPCAGIRAFPWNPTTPKTPQAASSAAAAAKPPSSRP